jgi:hypothetical protein
VEAQAPTTPSATASPATAPADHVAAPAAASAASLTSPQPDATAAAPPVAPPPPPPDFYHADTDFDAKISFAEAQKVWPQLTRHQFDAADLDGSGSLNADEYSLLLKHPPPLRPKTDQPPAP